MQLWEKVGSPATGGPYPVRSSVCAFPHESTAEQLYTELQFESYRELGSHVMRSILEGLYPGSSLEDFFLKVEGDLGSPPGCA